MQELVDNQYKFEKFVKEKFSQVKLYMAESNEMLKHHSDMIGQSNLSNGDKIVNVKKEHIDHQIMIDSIKSEVKKN